MSTKRNIIYNLINSILSVIFPLITVPYVSRILGAENIGIVSFSTTYALYFVNLALLGIPLYGVREIAKRKEEKGERDKLFSELLLLSIIASIISTVLYIGSIFISETLFEKRNYLYICSLVTITTFMTMDWYFQGRDNFRFIAVRSVVIKVLSIIGLFIFVKSREDVIPYLLIVIFSTVGNNLWNFLYISTKEIKIRFNRLNITQHLKPLMYLFFSCIAVNLYMMLDTVMLGFLSNDNEVGLYSSCIKVYRLLLTLIASVGTVLLPLMAFAWKNNDQTEINRLVQRSFNTMTFVSVPAAIGLFCISGMFVPFFFGQEFIGAIPTMRILSLTIIIISLSSLNGYQALVALEHNKLVLLCSLIGLVVNFTINMILIPRYGAAGASIASVIAEGCVTIVSVSLAHKFGNIRISWQPLWYALAASIPIILCTIGIKSLPLNPNLKMFSIIILGGLMYWITQQYIIKNPINKEIIQLVTSRFHIKK